jgi:hypothetical protein
VGHRHLDPRAPRNQGDQPGRAPRCVVEAVRPGWQISHHFVLRSLMIPELLALLGLSLRTPKVRDKQFCERNPSLTPISVTGDK